MPSLDQFKNVLQGTGLSIFAFDDNSTWINPKDDTEFRAKSTGDIEAWKYDHKTGHMGWLKVECDAERSAYVTELAEQHRMKLLRLLKVNDTDKIQTLLAKIAKHESELGVASGTILRQLKEVVQKELDQYKELLQQELKKPKTGRAEDKIIGLLKRILKHEHVLDVPYQHRMAINLLHIHLRNQNRFKHWRLYL